MTDDAPLSVDEWPLALRSFHDGIAEIGCARCDVALLALDDYSSMGDGFSVAWLVSQIGMHRETCDPRR
jgi:hypothetical protein